MTLPSASEFFLVEQPSTLLVSYPWKSGLLPLHGSGFSVSLTPCSVDEVKRRWGHIQGQGGKWRKLFALASCWLEWSYRVDLNSTQRWWRNGPAHRWQEWLNSVFSRRLLPVCTSLSKIRKCSSSAKYGWPFIPELTLQDCRLRKSMTTLPWSYGSQAAPVGPRAHLRQALRSQWQ